jgi:uncharacterized protein with FMN-binding domain
MKKSFVTAAVTILFVVYSFFQRTFGEQATAGAVPSPTTGPVATSAPQVADSNPTPAPAPSASPSQAQANPSPSPRSAAPAAVRQPTATPTQQAGSPYKDGTYAGVSTSAYWGNMQVQATVANGQLTNIQFLQWPNDRSRSVRINQQALPLLVQEAIQAQSGKVNVISGATDSSRAFSQSLQSALVKAQAAVGQAQSTSGQTNG